MVDRSVKTTIQLSHITTAKPHSLLIVFAYFKGDSLHSPTSFKHSTENFPVEAIYYFKTIFKYLASFKVRYLPPSIAYSISVEVLNHLISFKVSSISCLNSAPLDLNLYRHTLFTPLYATRGSFGPGNIL